MLKALKLSQRCRPLIKSQKILGDENFGQNWAKFDKKHHLLQNCDFALKLELE